MLLVQGRGEMAVMPTVIAVLLQHSAVDTGTECSVISKMQRENSCYNYSYRSTNKSQCCG